MAKIYLDEAGAELTGLPLGIELVRKENAVDIYRIGSAGSSAFTTAARYGDNCEYWLTPDQYTHTDPFCRYMTGPLTLTCVVTVGVDAIKTYPAGEVVTGKFGKSPVIEADSATLDGIRVGLTVSDDGDTTFNVCIDPSALDADDMLDYNWTVKIMSDDTWGKVSELMDTLLKLNPSIRTVDNLGQYELKWAENGSTIAVGYRC